MNKKVLFIIGLLTICIIAVATISSYGSITGYATVEQSITLDIIGSSNDANYSIQAYQGESVYSPKIKLINRANTPIDVNITVSILPESIGNQDDVTLSIKNEFKNETLRNPVTIPVEDLYFYVKHDFKANANPGVYVFQISVIPT
jgi:hypothetical protein